MAGKMTGRTAFSGNFASSTADQGAAARIMTGKTTGGVMNFATAVKRCCRRGMTGKTTGNRAHGMSMAVTVEVGAMTTLTVLAAGGADGATGQGTGSSIMTAKTSGGVMGLTSTGIRYGGRGMTVNTKRYGTHGMLGSARTAMLMAVEVTAMTGGAVLAAGGAYRRTLQAAVVRDRQVMTGSTTGSVMNLTYTDIRYGGSGMTVNTQGLGRHRMTMTVGVEVSRMTS